MLSMDFCHLVALSSFYVGIWEDPLPPFQDKTLTGRNEKNMEKAKGSQAVGCLTVLLDWVMFI